VSKGAGWWRHWRGCPAGIQQACASHTATHMPAVCITQLACHLSLPSAPAPPTLHPYQSQNKLSRIQTSLLFVPPHANRPPTAAHTVNHARRCRLAGAASNQSRLLLLAHARASNMCCSSTLSFKTETSPLLAHMHLSSSHSISFATK
jgi:hypothetical protein